MEELRLQRLRQREEAERLEGLFNIEIPRRRRDATMGGTIDPATDDDDTVDRSKGAGAAKGAAKERGKGLDAHAR